MPTLTREGLAGKNDAVVRRVLILTGGVIAAAFAVVAVLHSGGLTVVPGNAFGMTILLGAGGSAILAGILLARSDGAGRVGMLLAGSGIVWFLAVCATPGTQSPLVFSIGSIAASGGVALVAHLAFVAPADADRMGGVVRATVATGYAVTLAAGVGAVLFVDPRLHGCGECPTNPMMVRDDPDLAAAVIVAAAWLALGWTALAGGMLLLRITRAARNGSSIVMLVAIFALLLLLGAARPLLSDGGLGFALAGWAGRSVFWVIAGCALTGIALTLVFARMTARRSVRTLAHVLFDQGRVEPADMTFALRTALGDPLLEIRYPSGDAGYVTSEGESTEVVGEETRWSTPLRAAGVESALVVHRPALFDSPGLREDVASTARLGLAHERLLAVRRAQLRALEASRDRLLEGAAAERRRLARDLHDGAQQQLVGLALLLRFARSRIDEQTAPGVAGTLVVHLTAAQNGTDAALRALRSLTRGLKPEYEGPGEVND